jgi:hypothetical protein
MNNLYGYSPVALDRTRQASTTKFVGFLQGAVPSMHFGSGFLLSQCLNWVVLDGVSDTGL